MKSLAASIAVIVLLAGPGCGYGPDHLPALYQQRDHFQEIIDDVLLRMATDKAWWASLSPERRKHWEDYLERMRLEERERALDAISSITEAEATADGGSPGRAGIAAP